MSVTTTAGDAEREGGPRSPLPCWAPPLLALQFLTRVPVPTLARLPAATIPAGLRAAVAWFPLVGALIGGVTAAVLLGAARLWSAPVATLLALAFEAWLTGAFHEDAVADFCDAFGGARDREETLRILRDSRVGSYGALGLALAVLLRAACLASLPSWSAALALIAASAFGRWLVVLVLWRVPPAPVPRGLGKDVGGTVSAATLLAASLLAVPGLAPLALQRPLPLLLALPGALLFLAWFARLLRRRLGGSTGDCLGFAAYVGQLLVLLAVAAEFPLGDEP